MESLLLALFLFLGPAGVCNGNQRSTAAAYFLYGNKTDSCYDKPYISDRAECIERLVTLYFGDSFSEFCPNSVHWFAAEKCRGCPWDKIDVNTITPAIAKTLNRSELFHPPAQTCSLAQYLTKIRMDDTFLYLSFFGFAIPLFSGILLAKSDANGSPTTPQVFGSKLKEPIYFVYLWILFFVGYGISIAGHEIYRLCDGPLSFFGLMIGDWINMAIMMWTSMRRCRYLEARGRPQEVISWASYRESVRYRARSLWHRRLVDFIFWGGPGLILLSAFLEKQFENDSFGSFCQSGSYKSIPYGLIEYSKILIEIIAVGVYSLGPARNPVLFYTRYCFLIIILLVSVGFLYVMRLPVYETQCFSMLLPHVHDCYIAGPLHAAPVAHSFATALLGAAEPLRLGWPKPFDFECTAEDDLRP